MFEPNDNVLAAQIKSNLPREILAYEPRVDLQEIGVSQEGSRCVISLLYKIKETGQLVRDNLRFTTGNIESLIIEPA